MADSNDSGWVLVIERLVVVFWCSVFVARARDGER